MAKLTKEAFIESLNEMSILEIKELVDAMKEAYGVDPSAVAVAAAPAAEAKEEGPSAFDVVLSAVGANKLAVIKLIKEITGLGLGESKAIADNGGVIKEKVAANEANEMKAKFEIKELVDAMKEAYGVDPSAVAVAAAPAAEAKEEGPSAFDVVLSAVGANKLAVIKLIKEITGLGLGESKAIADNGGVIKEKVAANEANEMKAKFEEAGATIELK